MGKNLRQQRRGKGKYRPPAHRYLGPVSYRFIPQGAAAGVVEDIVDAPGKTTPLAVVNFAGAKVLYLPHQGTKVGEQIGFENPDAGSIVELRKIPEGTKIYNIELRPGDGGKICRTSGSSATLISREGDRCIVLMPSKQKKVLRAGCRATIGTVAGFARVEKPFRKAGNKWHAMRALGRLYPRVSGVAMNPVDHPFGGKGKPGKHKTVKRSMPPGKKVGSVAARRMGKKKRK
ncbi:MAG: 50S ribosomal protein L2 [Candidatus Aenigmarchaeota archaeon]|nr:50S ribosomal protein L2 [Candidatus Aenigmarchaeota archaeon]